MMEMGQGEVPLTAIRKNTIQGELSFKYSRKRLAPLVQALQHNTLIHSITMSGLPQARVSEVRIHPGILPRDPLDVGVLGHAHEM